MKILPRYVKKGEPVAASEYNNLIRNQRNSVAPDASGPAILTGLPNRISPPYSVIDIGYVEHNGDQKLVVKLKPGYVLSGGERFHVFNETNTEEVMLPLGLIPEIIVPQDLIDDSVGWLYVDFNDYQLKWHGRDEYDSNLAYIARFYFDIVDDVARDISFEVLTPGNVMKTPNTEFAVTPWNFGTSDTPVPGPEPESCSVTINPGFVWTIDPKSDSEVLIKKRITNGEDPPLFLDGEVPVIFEGVEKDQIIYLKIKTNDKGVVEEDPEIYIGGEEEENKHFYPDPVSADGEYYYPLAKIKLLEFEAEEDSYWQFVAEQYSQGPFYIQADLVTLKNVGEKREVFKTYKEDLNEYQFRTLEQLEATSGVWKPIIKEEPENPTEAAALETIQFKYLTQRASQPQIQLEDVGENGIRIKGNGVEEDLTDVVGFNITIEDGLISSFLKNDLGKNLNLTIKSIQYNNDGEIYGSATTVAVLYFRNGIFVGTDAPGGGAPAGLLEFEVTQLISAA